MFNSKTIKSVFFPTDFSEEGNAALLHALHFSEILKTPLTVFHAGNKEKTESQRVITENLIKLGLLYKDEPPDQVLTRLNLQIINAPHDDDGPLQTILNHLRQIPDSLLILPTEGREGLPRWLHPSLAEKIAEESKLPAVFIPEKCNQSLKQTNNQIKYGNILIPIDHKPDPQISIHFACWFAGLSNEINKIILFHAGQIADIPWVELPKASGYVFHKIHEPGDPVDNIIQTVEEYQVDLIVMATAGKQGFMDALTGSVTEKVIRHASCPVIAVPAI